MSGKIKDTKYLYASSRVRALENRLLTRERLERMIEARSDADALKVLTECGYPDVFENGEGTLEECLRQERRDVYALISGIVPDAPVVEVFRIRHDYHNVKTLIKSEAAGGDASRLLSDCGRISPSALSDIFLRLAFNELPAPMGKAAQEARELLARTSDAQLSDFVLDRACFAEMLETAARSGSAFLTGYVRLSIDAVNLRSFVRSIRTGRARVLKEALIPGGNIAPDKLEDALRDGASLSAVYSSGPLAAAAEEGEARIRDKTGLLSRFEKLCEGAVNAYLEKARMAPFGEQPVAAYLAAREAEMANVRTVMAGRFSKMPPDAIRERLRDTYV